MNTKVRILGYLKSGDNFLDLMIMVLEGRNGNMYYS
jgi:hypothetical protein